MELLFVLSRHRLTTGPEVQGPPRYLEQPRQLIPREATLPSQFRDPFSRSLPFGLLPNETGVRLGRQPR